MVQRRRERRLVVTLPGPNGTLAAAAWYVIRGWQLAPSHSSHSPVLEAGSSLRLHITGDSNRRDSPSEEIELQFVRNRAGAEVCWDELGIPAPSRRTSRHPNPALTARGRRCPPTRAKVEASLAARPEECPCPTMSTKPSVPLRPTRSTT